MARACRLGMASPGCGPAHSERRGRLEIASPAFGRLAMTCAVKRGCAFGGTERRSVLRSSMGIPATRHCERAEGERSNLQPTVGSDPSDPSILDSYSRSI